MTRIRLKRADGDLPFLTSGKSARLSFAGATIAVTIAGLTVGGWLVSKELIAAAELRGLVGQVGQFKAAASAFRSKYGHPPGDLPSAKAAKLRFFSETTYAGLAGHQDGDGFVQSPAESLGFWRHLTDAQLIDGTFGTWAAYNALDPETGVNSRPVWDNDVGELIPPAAIGDGSYFVASQWDRDDGRFNALQLTGVTAIGELGFCETTYLLTPGTARAIDAKLDDGLATGNTMGLGAGCTAKGKYDLSPDKNSPRCGLLIRLGRKR